MKKICLTLLIAVVCAGIQAQNGLQIASVFKAAKSNREFKSMYVEGDTATLAMQNSKGEFVSMLPMHFFCGLLIEDQPRLIEGIVSKLEKDTKKVIKKYERTKDGYLQYAAYWLPPRRGCKTDSSIMFRREGNSVAVFYLESKEPLDDMEDFVYIIDLYISSWHKNPHKHVKETN